MKCELCGQKTLCDRCKGIQPKRKTKITIDSIYEAMKKDIKWTSKDYEEFVRKYV
tara:strand:+ start:12578 stop:12742 length:165 start_codon:yes stop_codon:yes gene_type:complete